MEYIAVTLSFCSDHIVTYILSNKLP